MKTSTLACVAGVAVPLILSRAASGGYYGVDVVSKQGAEQYGLFTTCIYANFSRPGEDFMQAVAGTPGRPLYIAYVNGTFFQHSLGTNRAPLQAHVNLFPSLAYDTFVTIGVKTVGNDPQGGGINVPDQLMLSPTFPFEIGPGPLQLSNDSWVVTPAQAQSNPFNPDYAAGDGHVLIGQFTSADATCMQVTMLLQFVSNGVVVQDYVSFYNLSPAPGAVPLLAIAGLLGRGRRRR